MIIGNNLPIEVKQALLALQADENFDKIFKADAELDDLERCVIDLKDEMLSLQLMATGKNTIAGYDVNGLSPLALTILWLMKNKVIDDIENVTPEDIDIFLYLINTDSITFDVEEIKKASKDFMVVNDISVDDAMEVVIKTLKLAFLPLKILHTGDDHVIKEKAIFDTTWLANTISVVAKITNLKPAEIMRMPLNMCSHCLVEFVRMNSASTKIERQPEEDALKAMNIRTCELAIDYIASLGVIKEEEKEKYFKLICEYAD